MILRNTRYIWTLLAICVFQEVRCQIHNERAICRNPVPGLDKMSHGVDITTFDLFSKNSDGLRQRVIQYTCEDGNTKTIDKTTYDLPDQMADVTDVPGGIANAVTTLIRTYSQSREAMAADLGVDGVFKTFGFSASASLSSMHDSIFNKSRYIERVSAFESARRAETIPDFALVPDRYVESYIEDRLPATFTPSHDLSVREPYRDFIHYFGTHYFEHANFGGLFLVDLETRSDYYLTHDESRVEAQAKASFLDIIKGHGGYSDNIQAIDSQFKAMTTQTVRYYGGSTNLLSSGSMSRWQPTVSEHPWLFSGRLALISNLIRNDSKRKSMETAVTDYVLRAHLDELARLLSGRMYVWKNGLSKLQQLLDQVKELKGHALLNVAEVETLSDAVQKQVEIPQWFVEKTQLCFEWYPDGDAGQCSAPSRHLCAAPGLMTPEYRDDTDSRGGGCRMHWGLTASHHDDWFNDVQMCFHWRADGDGGQCGGGVGQELCAKANSYTPYYRDDTDRRGGGCLEAWKIQVPASAPAWADNLQLCHEWRPDGDSGQCGHGVDRRLCALANSWTQYYRDDTDRRSGGCRESWGIKVTV